MGKKHEAKAGVMPLKLKVLKNNLERITKDQKRNVKRHEMNNKKYNLKRTLGIK